VNKNENSKNILIVDLWFKKNIFSPFKNSLKKNHSMVLQIAIIAKKKNCRFTMCSWKIHKQKRSYLFTVCYI